MTDQQQPTTPASDARLSDEAEREFRAWSQPHAWPADVTFTASGIRSLLGEIDALRADLAASRAAAARLREAADAMAEAIQRGTRELPRGGMTGGGDLPYSETWRMFRQSLDAYRAAAATPPAPDAGAGSGG